MNAGASISALSCASIALPVLLCPGLCSSCFRTCCTFPDSSALTPDHPGPVLGFAHVRGAVIVEFSKDSRCIYFSGFRR